MLGAAPDAALRRAASAGGARSTTCPSETPGRVGQGRRRRHCATKAAAGLRARGTASTSTSSSERDGFLGRRAARAGDREVLPERLDAIVRGLAFSKSMRWDDSGTALRAAGALACWRSSDDETASVGEHIASGTASRIRARSRSRPPTTYAERCARPTSSRTRRSGGARSSKALDAIGGWSDPARQARRGRPPGRVAARARRRASTSGSSQLPERVDRDRDAVAPALLPARRAAGSPSSRTAAIPRSCAPATRRCSRAGSRTRASPSSATSRSGSTGSPSGSRSITFFAGAGSFADKTRAARASSSSALGGGEASLEAARLAKADQASELVREFPELEGYIGAEYARLAGYPEAVSAAIEEQYLPGCGRRAAAADRAGQGARRGGQDRHAARSSFALGHRPTGSRDPYGAAPRGDRPVPAGAGGRAAWCRARSCPDECGTSSRSGSRACSTCRSSSCARRAPRRRRELGGVARLAQALHDERESPAFDGVYTAYDARGPARGHARRTRPPRSSTAALLEEDAERALADGARRRSQVDGDVRPKRARVGRDARRR